MMLIISYVNTRLKNLCDDQKAFNLKYGFKFNSFKKAIMSLTVADNIQEVIKNHRGLRIEKLRGFKNTGSFRISRSYRVNFKYNESIDFLLAREIVIVKIHNHKY